MKKILIYGNFNIIHPGHTRLLNFGKNFGTMYVGVFSDKVAGKSAYISEKLRLESIKNLSVVDHCFIIKDTLEKIITKIKPDIVVKGYEYENKYNPEENVIKKNGGKLIFSSGETLFSSQELIKNELKISFPSIKLSGKFINRHKINIEKIIGYLDKIKKLNILVIGDSIIDKYIHCEAEGMSREDPALVVSPHKSETFIGGAAIVAINAKNLGAKVNFITIKGEDELGKFLKKKLEKKNIKTHFFHEEYKGTSHKIRYKEKNKTLLRINHINKSPIALKTQKKIIDKIESIKEKIDLVVYSDFNYGCLPDNLVKKLNLIFKKKKITQVADSQSSSQVGNISRFKEMMLITPTELEARLSCRNFEDGLIILSSKLKKLAKAKNLLLTLNKEGILIDPNTKEKKFFLNDKIEAFNKAPIDVIGAGDAMFISSSLLLKTGASIWESAFLGSICSAIQVSKIGNEALRLNEIRDFILDNKN